MIVTGLAANSSSKSRRSADHTNVDTTSCDAVQEISDPTWSGHKRRHRALLVARRGTVVLAGLKYGKPDALMSKEIRIQGALADYDS